MENIKRGLSLKKGRLFAIFFVFLLYLLIGKEIGYARIMKDYTSYYTTNGWYYLMVYSADGLSYGRYKIDVSIKERYWESNSYYVDYSMNLVGGTDQGISLRKNRFFTYCDMSAEDLKDLGYAEVERQYHLPNWIDFNKPGYTLSEVSNEGTAQTYINEIGPNYTYYIVDTNGCGITRWHPQHVGVEFHDTIQIKFTPNSYDQTINYYTYNASGSYSSPNHNWNLLGSKSWSQEYSTYFNAYDKRSAWGNVLGYHWWCINSNGWTVSGAGNTNSHYYPNKYRLNVDLNKGSGSTNPSGISGNFDMEYGTYISLGTPSRVGYTFNKWQMVSDNSVGSSLSSSIFTMGYNNFYPYQDYTDNATVNINAIWSANKYIINFNPNNGLIDGSPYANGVDTHTFYDDKNIYQNLANFGNKAPSWAVPNRTYKEGYTLVGWYDAKNGGTLVFNADGSKNLSASNYWDSEGRYIRPYNSALYGHYTPNTYNITYNGNGGTRYDTGEESYSNKATFDASYHIDKNYFAKDGYLFSGWSTSPDGPVSSTWLPDTDITMKTPNNITLYAVWEKVKWTASGTKENGDTVFGVNTAIAGNVTNLSALCNTIKSTFLLNSNISINPWESGVDYATPLDYMQYGDMSLYLYTNIEDGEFKKVTYEFDAATGIETVVKELTDSNDSLTVQIPPSIAYNEVYSVKVTIENPDAYAKASQTIYFTYKKMNLDELLSRIRNQ